MGSVCTDLIKQRIDVQVTSWIHAWPRAADRIDRAVIALASEEQACLIHIR